MLATHRVKTSIGDTVGFIVDERFYTDYTIRKNINYIDNLILLKDGTIRANK